MASLSLLLTISLKHTMIPDAAWALKKVLAISKLLELLIDLLTGQLLMKSSMFAETSQMLKTSLT